MSWQEIESAPKDGSLVDLWWDGIRLVDCFWMDANDAFPGRLVGWVCTKSPKEPFHLSEIRAEPTHWMPLPAPPGADQGIPVYRHPDATDDVLGKT